MRCVTHRVEETGGFISQIWALKQGRRLSTQSHRFEFPLLCVRRRESSWLIVKHLFNAGKTQWQKVRPLPEICREKTPVLLLFSLAWLPKLYEKKHTLAGRHRSRPLAILLTCCFCWAIKQLTRWTMEGAGGSIAEVSPRVGAVHQCRLSNVQLGAFDSCRKREWRRNKYVEWR